MIVKKLGSYHVVITLESFFSLVRLRRGREMVNSSFVLDADDALDERIQISLFGIAEILGVIGLVGRHISHGLIVNGTEVEGPRFHMTFQRPLVVFEEVIG